MAEEGPGAAAFLGPSEPNWARKVSARRLAGILNLSCLLSRTTYISDNDVADNLNLFDSFRGRSDLLYNRLRKFAELGFVRILLRDETFRPHLAINVDSFSDLYAAWRKQDPTDAWIVQDFGRERESYFAEVDSWARGQVLTRYPYRPMKRLFMENVRLLSYSEEPSGFLSTLRGLPLDLQREYYDLLDREWFSLTDVNELFQRRGLAPDHPAMLHQGLMNQVTFSSFNRNSLVGADSPDSAIEADFWGAPEAPGLRHVSLEEVLARADAVLDAPSLATLAVLRPDEIAHLRTMGESYFALLDLSEDKDYWSGAHTTFGSQFVRAAVDYWGKVSDYLLTHYSAVFEHQTQLALFLGYDPDRKSIPRTTVSVAVEAGIDMADAFIPAPSAVSGAAKKVLKAIKLRFLFLTPTDEFQRIRSVLPSSFWFRRSRPTALRQRELDR
jgi:hypothetical protein